MRRATTLILASLLGLSVSGHVAAQESLSPTPAPGSAVAAPAPATPAGAGQPATPRPGGPNGDAANVENPKPPAANAAPRPAADVKSSPVAAELMEAPATAPISPANEPSVLPPSDASLIPEPESEPEPDLNIPDTGPGSISQPLISGVPDQEPTTEDQPVPVRELGLFFGIVLLLSAGYLSYTARMTDPDEAPGPGPSARP